MIPVVVARGDARYPAALEDHLPPAQLWCLGNLDLLGAAPMVAIVGTRNCTAYAERTARGLAAAVARAGGCVVSGMARGVDAAAHRGALEAGGGTIAVLGTGVDVAYPASHRALHREIVQRGLVISEVPPGRTAFPGCFPRRNRIIAGIAPVTVVVEGGHKSGALNTAGTALNLGRTVAAVPGEIDNPQSAGSNALLRDGAHVIVSIDELLQLAGLQGVAVPRFVPRTQDEASIVDILRAGEATADVLSLRSGLPAARCFATITALELEGAIECTLGGAVRLR